MILDTLENADRYASAHPLFTKAFQFLRGNDLAALPPGRIDIDGDRLFALPQEPEGRGREGARLEAHRKYIDIQVTVSGHEEIGWKGLKDCKLVSEPYRDDKDILFFGDLPDSWTRVAAGQFVIYWPEDAHAPLGGRGPMKKVVLKIAVEG